MSDYHADTTRKCSGSTRQRRNDQVMKDLGAMIFVALVAGMAIVVVATVFAFVLSWLY